MTDLLSTLKPIAPQKPETGVTATQLGEHLDMTRQAAQPPSAAGLLEKFLYERNFCLANFLSRPPGPRAENT
jgi:hypothetical protein